MPSAPHPTLSMRTRFGLLPIRERVVVALLLGCGLLPAVALLSAQFADPNDASWLVLLGRHPALAVALAAALGVFIVFLWERPRVSSPAAYLAQLRQRLQEVQSAYYQALSRHVREEYPDAVQSPPSAVP